MKIDVLKMAVNDKAAVIREMSEEFDIPLKNIAYVGDDINDLEAVKLVGWGCCVANAAASVKQAAKYISHAKGGSGAIREIIDHILCSDRKKIEED